MKSITDICGCCEGIEVVTPQPTANRPGLSELSFRIGTHGAFLESTLARLWTHYIEIPLDEIDEKGFPKTKKIYPLQKLTARSSDDPAIALLDAWAIVADVLAFYSERIINEGYLRTATERRSILELARLVGYKLRPGVSASVYFAYTLDDNAKDEVVIPKGARSQSIPGPGELPQSFETSEELKARAKWNNLKPRMTRPQTVFSILLDPKGPRVYLKGIQTNLKTNDPLLIDFVGNNKPIFYRVDEVMPDAAADRTLIKLQTKTNQIVINPQASDPLKINRANKGVKIILLNDGDELTEFFSFTPLQNSKLIFKLVSVKDRSHTLMELLPAGIQGKVTKPCIRLKGHNNESFFTVEKAEVLEVSSFQVSGLIYFRITLQKLSEYDSLIKALILPPSTQPQNELRLNRKIEDQFFSESTTTENSEFLRTTILARDGFDLLVNNNLFSEILDNLLINSIGSIQGLNALADGNNAILKNIDSLLRENLANANANAGVTGINPIKIYSLRTKATPFASNAPPRQKRLEDGRKIYSLAEWQINDPLNERIEESDQEPEITATDFHTPKKLYLDAEYEILPNSWVVIENTGSTTPLSIQLDKDSIQQTALAAYGISGKSTLLSFNRDEWFTENSSFQVVRNTRVYIQSEEMELAEESLVAPVCGGKEELIELNDYYEDLQSGRWVVVSGEREDVIGTSGIRSRELAMISVVKQDVNHQLWEGSTPVPQFKLLGDKIHTFIELAEPLKYCFKRDTVTINANVVKATHGETRKETLGSGDGAKALQSFLLKQPPLTFVSASNPTGVDSTLDIFVNDVKWHETEAFETEALVGLKPLDRNFITKTDDEGKTIVVFGNGREGTRLPTGIENIKAEYRNGIGKSGNVKAEQISLLISRPLGVKEVINPLRATGGADKESRDQARKNAPLAIKALDRLVSVQDYEDFTRTYAGIGKARAAELSDGRRQLVHITIAGSDDIPIDKNSDLYRNLRQTLFDFGDPYQAIQLELRELMFIVIQANIRIQPDYLWEPVVTQVRIALLDAFSFERRELGQDVLLSEVLSVMQAVRGVEYVDVDAFGGIPEKKLMEDKSGRQLLMPAEIASVVDRFVRDQTNRPETRLKVNLADFEQEAKSIIHPAQLAFLTPEVPATLILNQIT